MGADILLRERRGKVGVLVLNRPEKANALSLELIAELRTALAQMASDDSIRVLVLRGSGARFFCAGFDIPSIPADFSEGADADAVLKSVYSRMPLPQLMADLKNYPYPTIAMLNGAAIGAGFNLAMCCDLRIASDQVEMGITPARLGLVYFPEGIKQVAEALGTARSREVFFTGAIYGPAEVKNMGLVHQMVLASELENATFQLAEQIAENAPLSLKGMKKILNMLGRGMELSESERREAEMLLAQSFCSHDLKEGIRSFLQKRKPEFRGR
jgi:enoyl-CoA hydratase/carnithine racemase